MTNEEILGQAFYPHECGSMIECVTKQDALKSMDLARKDEAVAFGEWMDSEGKFYSRSQTIEQLYSIFKQQNEKQ